MSDRGVVADVYAIDHNEHVPTILERPLYSIGEAARLLCINPTTLRRWVLGGTVSGKFYPAVIRPQPREDDAVTWAEFVEAGLLREYRGKLSLQYLRTFIDDLREVYGVPYPLAHERPVIDLSTRRLVHALPGGILEGHGSNQLQWEKAAESFLQKVTFDAQGVAVRFLPRGIRSPIVIDPEVVFGIPQIRGIRTETLMEEFAGGVSIHAIAADYRLSSEEVEAALQFEANLKMPVKVA